MGLLDSLFNQSTYGGQGGGLLDFLRQSQMQQDQYQPSAGFPGASPIGIGGYQMPRMGDADQFTPPPQDPAALPPNAQPTQGQLPQAPQQEQLPPALGGHGGFGAALRGFANNAHTGPIGALIGAIGSGMGATNPAQQNLKAQYDALVPLVGPQKAMLAVMNPEAGKTILAQALEKQQPTFGVIGEADGGGKAYGFIDPTKKTVTPYTAAGSENRGTITGPDGKEIPIPPGVDAKTFRSHVSAATADAATGKKTEVQAKSEKFANKMELAEKNVATLQNEGSSVTGRGLDMLPGGNFLQSKEYQKYRQAQDNFITALLRDESGAAIGTQEFKRYERELFPQPGDGPEVVAQKAQARKVAIEAMKKSAGPGYKTPETTSATPAAPSIQEGATATNPQTGQKLTFRNGKWQ